MRNGGHDNIIRMIGTVTCDGAICTVSEYCDGSSLNKLAGHTEICKLATFKTIAEDIIAGLVFLQERRIIHRDLAPRNYLRKFSENDKASKFKILPHILRK